MQPTSPTDVLNASVNVAPELSNILMLFASFVFLNLLLSIVAIIALWKVFSKAGKPGWAAIIPIYNIIVMLQIIQKPVWWVVLIFIPLVNIIVGWLMMLDLGKAFGKGSGWSILFMILLGWIGVIVLGFGDSKYKLVISE